MSAARSSTDQRLGSILCSRFGIPVGLSRLFLFVFDAAAACRHLTALAGLSQPHITGSCCSIRCVGRPTCSGTRLQHLLLPAVALGSPSRRPSCSCALEPVRTSITRRIQQARLRGLGWAAILLATRVGGGTSRMPRCRLSRSSGAVSSGSWFSGTFWVEVIYSVIPALATSWFDAVAMPTLPLIQDRRAHLLHRCRDQHCR